MPIHVDFFDAYSCRYEESEEKSQNKFGGEFPENIPESDPPGDGNLLIDSTSSYTFL